MRGLSMFSLALLVVAAVGCSSSDSSDANGASASPVLDGVYQGDPNGSYAWAGLHDGAYVLWSAEPACNDAASSPPPSCQETGTFAFDPAKELLLLTESKSGQTRGLHIRIDGTESSSALIGQGLSDARLTPRAAGLVGGGAQLVTGGGSALVAKQFAVYQPSDGPLVAQQVNLRSTTFALLQCLAILSGDPADTKNEVPAPPPIVQTIGSSPPCKKK